MEFSESEEFQKEFKKLAKKYRTLTQDLAVLKQAIAAAPTGNGTKHWNILHFDGEDTYVLKTRMMCRAVRGSEFRVVYLYDGAAVTVLFIELYFKGDKANEDWERIKQYLDTL